VRYRHWLDGDGTVCSLQFGGGQVQFTNRFVRSKKFKEESEQGRCLYRTFGTAFKDDQLKHGLGLESPANVSVYPFNGTLLAFGEQGLPYELDPQTLETRGEYTFGGRLNAISPLSAHPHIDLETGEMFNFGISFAARRPCVQVYRIGPDGEIIYRKRVSIEQPCSMHDFNLSPSYVLIYLSPYTLDMEVLTGQSGTIMDALRWEPEQGSRLLVLSRETGEKLADIAVGSRYCLHHINAFEQAGQLVVDLIELDRPVYDQYQVLPDLFTDAPRARPVRLIVDPEKWQVSERREIDYTVSQDFPAIDPRRALRSYEDLWLLGISATAAAAVPGRPPALRGGSRRQRIRSRDLSTLRRRIGEGRVPALRFTSRGRRPDLYAAVAEPGPVAVPFLVRTDSKLSEEARNALQSKHPRAGRRQFQGRRGQVDAGHEHRRRGGDRRT